MPSKFTSWKKRFLLIAVVSAIGLSAQSQFPRVDIPGSQVRKIHSSIVSQDYELHILLPSGYTNSAKKYPVVYVMDSQWDFPLVKSIYGQQFYDGFIPEMIIVGVTWGGTKPNADSLRARDYTPTNDGRLKQGGGADKFLSFMKKELFRFIESNFRTDTEQRVLMGCSLGGLFTLYTLYTQPDMFAGYAAASPAIGWDKEVLYKFKKDFDRKALSSPKRLYMTVGDVENTRRSYEKFAAEMTYRTYSSLAIESKVLENTGHSGTKSETYSRGLQYIFSKSRYMPGLPNATWHGKKAAVVITYDDAIDQHLDNALPVLDSLGLRATFYVTGFSTSMQRRFSEWKTLAVKGHELGNHTLHHPCIGKAKGRDWVKPEYDLGTYTVQRMADEIKANNLLLQSMDGKTKRTFAFPCGDITAGDSSYVGSIQNEFTALRSTRHEMHLIDQIDLNSVDCFVVNGEDAAQLNDWVRKAIETNTLLVVLFHGVGGGNGLNVSIPAHRSFLQYLKQNEKDIWIAPMIEVAEHIRAYQSKKSSKLQGSE